MNAVFQWIDDRTGLGAAWGGREPAIAPSPPWWVAIWPGTIALAVFIEVVTGFFLWMFYSPSAQTAWESVYYVQHEVAGGWLLRGVHYHAAQVLLVLIALYVLSLIFSGAYRAPRELVFWLAVGMAVITIALLLTGDLLPWTQRGYWSTDVRTRFLLLLPWVGGTLYKLAIGGPEMGHLTLTRFVALHAGLLSAILAALVVLHACWARRAAALEGPRSEADPRATCSCQVLCQGIACAVVMGLVLATSSWGALRGEAAGQSPGDYLGAELGGPRDPGESYAAARPDWYFVGLYQFAHFFSGGTKIVPIFVVPGLLVLYFLVMPFLARSNAGHLFNVGMTVALVVGVLVLTAISKKQDAADESFQASLAAAAEDAVRVRELIQAQGIPSAGALALLWEDPKTQGPRLFRQHCVSCHDHAAADGSGMLAQDPSAPNLRGFAAKEWFAGLLDPKQIAYAPPRDPQTNKLQCTPTDRPRYFGGTEKLVKGEMIDFVKGNLREVRKEVGEKEFSKLVETLTAEPNRKPGEKPSEEVKQAIGDFTCFDCHHFHGENKAPSAPDLTRYGSQEWLIGIISDPGRSRFYGAKNERMPAYAKTPQSPENNILSSQQIEILADWLRGVWYQPQASAE